MFGAYRQYPVDKYDYPSNGADTVKVMVQVYSLISSLKTYHPILHFTPWSLDPFIRVPFQLNGEHTALRPVRRILLIVHTVTCVVPGTHIYLSQVSIWGWSDLPKGTTAKQWPKIETGKTWYFSENPAPSGARNRTAGSGIDKAWSSNHCAMFLS